MEKKAQSAIEFMIVVAIAMTIITGFLLAVQYNVKDQNFEKKNRLVLEIALNIQSELNFAQDSSNGYFREFTIPLKVLGSNYEVITGAGIISVRTTNLQHAFTLSVPPTMGEIQLGKNEIRRENGKVCANILANVCQACGNGIRETGLGEACEENVLFHVPPECEELPSPLDIYDFGPLVCNFDCQYDLSFCSNCGDGKLQGGEQCDDDNNLGGDGCSPICGIEAGWVCVSCDFEEESDCVLDATFQCQNMIDDDCDGELDFPEDFGCTVATDDDEVNNASPECSNGLDDDLDGDIDQDDNECTAHDDTLESS